MLVKIINCLKIHGGILIVSREGRDAMVDLLTASPAIHASRVRTGSNPADPA